MQTFNFFKVHPVVVVNLVADYIKNEVLLRSETIELLEQDLKRELFSKMSGRSLESRNPLLDPDAPIEEQVIPEDILVSERISCKLFQSLLRKYGVQLTHWEVYGRP